MNKLLQSVPQREEVKAHGGVNAAMIDQFLWEYTKSHQSDMEHIPIHRTLTIFY
jgi:hypothetical protein